MSDYKDIQKSRIFNCLLYPDNEIHKLIIMKLQCSYDCVGICHNLDCYEEDSNEHKAGELKKEHYHFVIKFKNPRTKHSVAKELQIDERFLDFTRSFKYSTQYLLHYGDEDKHQYSSDELLGKLKADVIKLLDDKPSAEVMAMNIFDYINSQHNYIKTTDLYLWACSNGYINFYIRAYKIIQDILFEHNTKYISKGGTVQCFDNDKNHQLYEQKNL